MKTCILFSGGWDSVAVALIEKDADLVFFDYGQKYYHNEAKTALKFAEEHGRTLTIRGIPLEHDIERRNFYLILEAKKMGYQKIYTGNRNLIPLFDKYRDSNWLTLKILALISNLKIKMPIVGWDKKRIVKYVLKNTRVRPYNCYENKSDPELCKCVNCLEITSVLRSIKK